MHNLYFEGDGSFTMSVTSNISLLSTTNTNNNDFTLKTRHPLKKEESYIHAIREDFNFEIENKIHISDYSLFHGPKCLSGLFNQNKFIPDDELIVYNVTSSTLKETEFDYVTYYFDQGDHEIPTTWKSRCRFEGINPNKTNFIFNDVYSYDGSQIDNFIDVNYKLSSNLNRITIKPSHYFYLSSFGNIYDWIWLRNLKTCDYIYKIQNTFATDKLNLFDQSYFGLTLTAHSIVAIHRSSTVHLYKNGISGFSSQSKTAKLIILYKYYDNDC